MSSRQGHESDSKKQAFGIRGRALEIYLDLCRRADQLPPGSSLPSLRQLQRQYTAGQQTVTTALKHLAATRQLLRRPYRKAQLYPTPSNSEHVNWLPRRTTTVTLGLSCSIAASWQPVIDRFNEKNHRAIKPCYVETLPELIALALEGKVDFILFHTNPITEGVLDSTLPFIDLKEFIKTLRNSDFYQCLPMVDPGNRHWGVSAVFSTGVILSNRRFGELPCRDFTWPELLPRLRKLKQYHSELLYPFSFNGYSTFLMQNGVLMVDKISGELDFVNDRFAESLQMLKGILDENLAPLFSETYYDLSSLRWFESGRIAAREVFLSAVKHFQEFCPEFDILPMPVARGFKRNIYSEFFSVCADSINYGTAWDFIVFALSRPMQEFLIKAKTVMPVRRHLRPPYLNDKQFEVFAAALEHCHAAVEDYYLPVKLRLIIETSVDRWNKTGGDVHEFLRDLEDSCKERLRHIRGSRGKP